jgi:hypothetical protein
VIDKQVVSPMPNSRRVQQMARLQRLIWVVYGLTFLGAAAIGCAFWASAAAEGHRPAAVEWIRHSTWLWWTTVGGGFAAAGMGVLAMARFGSFRLDDEQPPRPPGDDPDDLLRKEHEEKARTHVAVLVVHGIGVQNRYDTQDSLVRGLTAGLDGPGSPWQCEPVGEAKLTRVPPGCTEDDIVGKRIRVRLSSPEQPRQMDIFEVYWAPLAEGIMTWKDVLAWGATLLTRLIDRFNLTVAGSRAVPNPLDASPELREWDRQVSRQVRNKAIYEFIHVGILAGLAIAGVLLFVQLWLIGLGLASKVGSGICDGCTFAQAVRDVRAAGLRNFWILPEPGSPYSLFSGFHRQAELVGRLLAVEPWWGSLTMLYLTFTFAFGLYRLVTALADRRGGSQYLRVEDLRPHDESFLRGRLTTWARAVDWLGIYTVILLLWLHGPKDANRSPELLALPALALAAAGGWAALSLGGKQFLARYLADVPVQGDPSSYSKGARARRQIREQMIAMLAQVLREYPSVVVLAHSQGTVVTYEAFQTYQRRFEIQAQDDPELLLPGLSGLKAYVTFGVALSKVQDLVQGHADLGRLDRSVNQLVFDTRGIPAVDERYPCIGSTRWYNYWMYSDMVCDPIRDYMPVQEHLIGWYTLPAPRSLWTHSDYWDALPFYQALVAEERDAQGRLVEVGPIPRAFGVR